MTTETRTLEEIEREAAGYCNGPVTGAGVAMCVREAYALGAASRASPEEGRALGRWIRAFGHLHGAVAPHLIVNPDDPEAMAREAVEEFKRIFFPVTPPSPPTREDAPGDWDAGVMAAAEHLRTSGHPGLAEHMLRTIRRPTREDAGRTCGRCGGTGRWPDGPCDDCLGSGRLLHGAPAPASSEGERHG